MKSNELRPAIPYFQEQRAIRKGFQVWWRTVLGWVLAGLAAGGFFWDTYADPLAPEQRTAVAVATLVLGLAVLALYPLGRRYLAAFDLSQTGEHHVAACLLRLRAGHYSAADLETMAALAATNHNNLANIWMLPQAIWIGAFAAVVAGQSFLQDPWVFSLAALAVIGTFLAYLRAAEEGHADVVLQQAITTRLAELRRDER
jgi:hypothetical protein